jgi:IS1 family transposase
MANNLPLEKKAVILSLLAEGNSLRTISRVSGVARNTINKLLLDAGEQAREIMDRQMKGLKVKNLQVDEIWTFVQKKQKQLKPGDNQDFGDQYVFVAIDADTKLVPTFRVGKRTSRMAASFMMELSTRIQTRFQLSTDAFQGYAESVDRVFGGEIDYGQIHKQYSAEPGKDSEHRYSPANIIRVTKKIITGEPKKKNISTSYVERQNLTMRMQMRRFTRLTNAFSKSLKHLKAALAIHFFHYNFMRIHETLRITPAMEAGINKHLWTWEEFLRWNIQQQKAA